MNEAKATFAPLTQQDMKTFASDIPLQEARFNLTRDVVLPARTRLQLDECLARLRFHKKIYQDWGFEAVDPVLINHLVKT